MYFTYDMRVNSREVDAQRQARPSAVLGYLQEAATSAAISLGIGRDEMVAKYNGFWMLARIWYRLDKPLLFDEDFTVRTYHRPPHGASMYRDFDFLDAAGRPIGEAVSVWVLADVTTHKLMRFSMVEECQREDTHGGELCKTLQLSNLKPPVELTETEVRRMRYSDADVNGHVNNVHYADFACDALGMETLGKGKFVSSFQVGYHAECLVGEELRILTGETDGKHWASGKDGAEKLRFTTALTLSDLT